MLQFSSSNAIWRSVPDALPISQFSAAHYRTTMLTSLLGTTIFLTIFFPAIAALIFSSARAFSTMVSSDACRRNNPAAQLAVDLHGNFNLLFLCQLRHVFRPTGAEQAFLLA